MKKKTFNSIPTLVERQSTGGEIAQRGFMFQDGVLLSQLPRWLAQEGFSALIRESMGDTEVKFFIPGKGTLIDFWEAKDHYLTPTEFWDEIKRFKEIHEGYPGTYRSFLLASTGLSQAIQPIERTLRRIRDPYEFYGSCSPVITNSYHEFEQRVIDAGYTKEDAHFLFERVTILPSFGTACRDVEGSFRQGVDDYLPYFKDVTNRKTGDIYAQLESLIGNRLNSPVTRLEIESTISEELGSRCLQKEAISICTLTDISGGNETSLCFEWSAFFGDDNREYPIPDFWNKVLINELEATSSWIIKNRSTRRIDLSGTRRLSVSIAFGSVFSAVSGFAIDMIYRDEIWSTDTFPTSRTPAYELITTKERGDTSDLVVVIGIVRNILDNVQIALSALNIENASILSMYGLSPILSSDHANILVNQLKHEISKELTRTESEKIHLFFAGPAHLALFLGHRLNATAPVQCYEW